MSETIHQHNPALRLSREQLNDIMRKSREALATRGITYPVFFVIPANGDAVVTFGTTHEPDPPDEEWQIVTDVVTNIVQQTLGLGPLYHRDVVCAQMPASREITDATI